MKYTYDNLSDLATTAFLELMGQLKKDSKEFKEIVETRSLNVEFKVEGEEMDFMAFIEQFDKNLDKEVLDVAKDIVTEAYADLNDKAEMLSLMVEEQMDIVTNQEKNLTELMQWVYDNGGSIMISAPEDSVYDKRVKYQINLCAYPNGGDRVPLIINKHYMTLYSGIELIIREAQQTLKNLD